MMTSLQYTRPSWCQERLHRWAMWRITVNQELIHGLEGAPPIHGGQDYQSFMDNYSLTQRYIQNPEMQRDQTFQIRTAYGMPPSPKYPMGDTLYFLYGLPRVSATLRVPDVMSSHYASMPNLTFMESNSHENRTEPVRYPLTIAPAILQRTKSHDSRLPQSVNGHVDSPGQLNDIYPRKHKDNREKIGQAETRPEQTSPVNFRDKPETDFTHVHSSEGSEKVNNINKPVLVPPSVFQSEVLRRSNIDLPLNINGGGDDDKSTGEIDGEGFQDPRVSRFNERRQTYTWNDKNGEDIGSSRQHMYVDESYMKTHM